MADVITYREAVAEGIAREMRRDASVVCLGEDIAAAGGVFKTTTGLRAEFGPDRVWDTPISEQAIVGAAMGAAMTGMRPVAEIMFSDFLACCWDYLANEIPKVRYMTGGQTSVPAIFHVNHGIRGGGAAQHSHSPQAMMWNTPGRAAALYAVGDSDEVHAFLTFARPEPPSDALRDPAAQRDLFASVFADAGWEVPRLIAELSEADDLFADVVSQIRMPRWSRGRVALVGDAAYAPSFLTGQGSSLALVGAYMLAASLAERDAAAGFAAYEHGTRGFVTLNQDQIGRGDATLFPTTSRALEQRNDMLRTLGTMPADGRPAHSALTLPDSVPTR